MVNKHIAQRLEGLQKILMGAYNAGSEISSASKGLEREHFVNAFLSQMMPPPYRFGHGDITDQQGRKSGQLDIVIEYPFLPSFPMISPTSSRLYLADGVVAAIEVKSNIKSQWNKVVKTAESVAALKRITGAIAPTSTKGMSTTNLPYQILRDRIPMFAVGYTGWTERGAALKRLEDKIAQTHIDAMLILDNPVFIINPKGQLSGSTGTGVFALWSFVSYLHKATQYIRNSGVRLLDYAVGESHRVT